MRRCCRDGQGDGIHTDIQGAATFRRRCRIWWGLISREALNYYYAWLTTIVVVIHSVSTLFLLWCVTKTTMETNRVIFRWSFIKSLYDGVTMILHCHYTLVIDWWNIGRGNCYYNGDHGMVWLKVKRSCWLYHSKHGSNSCSGYTQMGPWYRRCRPGNKCIVNRSSATQKTYHRLSLHTLLHPLVDLCPRIYELKHV